MALKLTSAQAYNVIALFCTSGKRDTLRRIAEVNLNLVQDAEKLLDLYIRFKDERNFPGNGGGYVDVKAKNKAFLAYSIAN